MTDEQKEDLQFWLYTKIFADRVAAPEALAFAAAEVDASVEDAFEYLQRDQRVTGTSSSFTLQEFVKDESDPKGVYVDIEWIIQILYRAGVREQALWKALGSIYKIPPALARQEAEHIPIAEGEA